MVGSSCKLQSPHRPSCGTQLSGKCVPSSPETEHSLLQGITHPNFGHMSCSHTCHPLVFSVKNILTNIQGSFFKTSGLVWVSSSLFSPCCCFYCSVWMSYSTLIVINFEPGERFRSWMLNFMDGQWRPKHHPRTVCILEGPARPAKPLPSGPHVLEGNIFEFVKSWKLIKTICGCPAALWDLIVTIGHVGLAQLRTTNPRISSHLKGREAFLELPVSSNWI